MKKSQNTKPTKSGNQTTEPKETSNLNQDGKHLFQAELLSRLKKIEGQVRGVHKMIQECRNCGDVVIQLAAIKSAVNRVGNTVLTCHLAEKIEKDLREERELKETLEEFMTVFKKFS